MYKVFVNDNPLVLTDSYPDLKHEDLILYMKYDDSTTIDAAIEMLNGDGYVNKVIVYHSNVAELWNTLLATHTHIEAGGGIVTNEKGERLFIFRNGKWDLPKGKLDSGETPEQGAVREVMEETGLTGLKVDGELARTYHTYRHKDKDIVKTTHWFAMSCSNGQTLTPQAEEGIEVVEWLAPGDDAKVHDNTYSSIRELLDS